MCAYREQVLNSKIRKCAPFLRCEQNRDSAKKLVCYDARETVYLTAQYFSTYFLVSVVGLQRHPYLQLKQTPFCCQVILSTINCFCLEDANDCSLSNLSSFLFAVADK